MTEPDLSQVPPSLHWYFGHPGAWDHIKSAILTHDKSCVRIA